MNAIDAECTATLATPVGCARAILDARALGIDLVRYLGILAGTLRDADLFPHEKRALANAVDARAAERKAWN